MKGFQLINYIKTWNWRKYRSEIRRYLLLLLIPIILMLFLYVNVNQVVTHQAEEYAQLVVNHFHVQSASMLHEMQLVGNAILRNSDIDWVLKTKNANALDSLHICEILKDSLKESPYVQHVYLLCNNTGNIYSEQGLFTNESLSVILNNIGVEESDLEPISSEADFHMLNKSGLAPYCIFPIRDSGGNSIGTLIVTLRMTEFLRIFHSLEAELCAVFNKEVYISSYITNINVDHFDWNDEASISELVGEAVTCKYIEGEDYTYMVAVSRENYNRPLHVIVKWFFIYAVAALVLSYLYLYHVSKKRYQRISAMIEALPTSYTGDQSYEHVYENIRKSLEDYRTQWEYLQLENSEHTLHILLASSKDHKLSAEQFQNTGINPNSKFYYVATFFTSEVFDPAYEKDYAHGSGSFLRMLLRSTIKELAEQYGILYAFCGTHKIGIAVLYSDNAAELKDNVLELSRNVIEILTSSYTMNIQATISNPVTSVLNLPDAYQETQRLHSFAKSINSNATVISQEDLQHRSAVLVNGDFIRQEQILINTILARKYDVVPSMVESILTTHVSPLRKNYTLVQSRLQAISNVLVEGVRMASIPGISAVQEAKAIGQADSIQQLVSVTNRVYNQMAEQCRETTSDTDIITVACNYIEQNLSDQNLNVTVICEAAGVSVQRLTRMFQAQFNMAIAEYMNSCRIKLAKELLPNKQLTVSQIAQQVGYSNADTFTRNFRKVEGITASEYRKMLP